MLSYNYYLSPCDVKLVYYITFVPRNINCNTLSLSLRSIFIRIETAKDDRLPVRLNNAPSGASILFFSEGRIHQRKEC